MEKFPPRETLDFAFSNKGTWTKWSLKEMPQMVMERFPFLQCIVLGLFLGNIDFF